MTQITIVIPHAHVSEIRRGATTSLEVIREALDSPQRQRRRDVTPTEQHVQLHALTELLEQLREPSEADRAATGHYEELRTAICAALMGAVERLAVAAGRYWRYRTELIPLQDQHAAVAPYLQLLAQIARATELLRGTEAGDIQEPHPSGTDPQRAAEASTNIALDGEQRDAVRAHLLYSLTYGTIEDFPLNLELGNYEEARQTRDELRDATALLDDLGWGPDDRGQRSVLTLPPSRLRRVVDRQREQAAMILATHAIGTLDDDEAIELAKASLPVYGNIISQLSQPPHASEPGRRVIE